MADTVLLVHQQGYAQRSTDSISYAAVNIPASYQSGSVDFNSAANDGSGNWVIVGESGANLLSTDDALNFTGGSNLGVTFLRCVRYYNNQFIACGNAGFVYTSPTGASGTWTQRTTPTSSHLYSIGYDGTKLVIVGQGGAVISSADNGVTWGSETNTYTVGTTTQNRNVAWDSTNSLWIVCANWFSTGGTGFSIWTSPAGTLTWTNRVLQSSSTPQPTEDSIFTKDGTTYIGDVGGKYWESANATSWSRQTDNDSINDLTAIGFANALHIHGDHDRKIFTSPDYSTWTERTSAHPIRNIFALSVTYSSGELIDDLTDAANAADSVDDGFNDTTSMGAGGDSLDDQLVAVVDIADSAAATDLPALYFEDNLSDTGDGADSIDAPVPNTDVTDTSDSGDVFSLQFSNDITATANAVETISVEHFLLLIDAVVAKSGLDGSATHTLSLADSIAASEVFELVFDLYLQSDAVASDSTAPLIDGIINLVDAIKAKDTAIGQLEAIVLATSAVIASEALAFAYGADVTDQAQVTDALAGLIAQYVSLVDALIGSDAVGVSGFAVIDLSDHAAGSSLLNSQATLYDLINSGAAAWISIDLDGDLFTGWAINTETAAVSQYDNWRFNSFAWHEGTGKTFAARPDGIYEITGDSDVLDDEASKDIITRIRTGLIQLGSHDMKRLYSAAVGYTGENQVVLKVVMIDSSDGQKKEYWYKQAQQQAGGMREGVIHVGKGLRSRYWQFEVADFAELHVVEMFPMMLSRRR